MFLFEVGNIKTYTCVCLGCCLRTVKQWRHLKPVNTKWAQPLILFHLVFWNSCMFSPSPPTYLIFMKQVCKWLDSNPKKINTVRMPFCDSCAIFPNWSSWVWWGWVPNVNWDSTAATPVSKIPHLSLREAAWQMQDIFSCISFSNPHSQVEVGNRHSVWRVMVWVGTTVWKCKCTVFGGKTIISIRVIQVSASLGCAYADSFIKHFRGMFLWLLIMFFVRVN